MREVHIYLNSVTHARAWVVSKGDLVSLHIPKPHIGHMLSQLITHIGNTDFGVIGHCLHIPKPLLDDTPGRQVTPTLW
jgi:hypothetical protein